MMVEASELSAEQIRKANLIQVIWTSRALSTLVLRSTVEPSLQGYAQPRRGCRNVGTLRRCGGG